MPPAQVPLQLTVGPFTTKTAASYGVSTSALRGPAWRHLFRDVWVHADIPVTRELVLSAVRLILPDLAFVCGLTAALLYGIDARDPRGELVWVGYPTGIRGRARPGTLIREITVSPDDVQMWAAMPVTTEIRTVFDCARWLSLVEAVVVADHFAHLNRVSAEQLAAYAADRRGLRGMKQLDRVVELIEPLTESPMETRLRMLFVAAGLEGFKPQHVITDVDDKFVARVDFAFPAARLVVEYDGADHWKKVREDERRRESIRDLDWTVMVVSSDDYYRTPDNLIARVRSHLS